MKRRRASLEPAALEQALAGSPLPPEVVRYLTRVLRLRDGAAVELGDGHGRIATGRLEQHGAAWVLAEATLDERVRAALPLTLYAGLLKPKRWTLVVEKCVELGVGRLVPVLAEHAAFRPRPRDVEGLVDRWSRIALDAVKQSRRATATAIAPPLALADALAEAAGPNRLVADAGGAAAWPAEGLVARAATQVLVGPEGGLTDGERADAQAAGFVGVSLGGFALRAETAAIALLAIVRERLGFAGAERDD